MRIRSFKNKAIYDEVEKNTIKNRFEYYQYTCQLLKKNWIISENRFQQETLLDMIASKVSSILKLDYLRNYT